MQDNPNWKKCGYEEPCVLKERVEYDFFYQDGPEADSCGQIKVGTTSEDIQWVKYGEGEKWRSQAFVTAILREMEGEKQAILIPPLIS